MISPEITEFVYNAIINRYDTGIVNPKGQRCLHVSVMGEQFETYITDKEIKRCAEAATYIVDELIAINENGLYEPIFRDICAKEYQCSYMSVWSIVNKYLMNDQIKYIQNEMCEMLNTGGGYALVKSIPHFIYGIFISYGASVDKWEQPHIYETNVFFLARCIMRMNSDDLDL